MSVLICDAHTGCITLPPSVLLLPMSVLLVLLRLLLRPAIGKDVVIGGTYEFLAPEAMAGFKPHSNEPILAQESQDAYALGVMAYQLMTCDPQPPFAMKVWQCIIFLVFSIVRVPLWYISLSLSAGERRPFLLFPRTSIPRHECFPKDP